MPEKFDIYSKIFYLDVEKFVRHLCRLVLRHQMPVWNYFVNSFYSANGSKKAWPPQKNPQNDEYVFCQLKDKNLFPQTGIFQELKYRYS